jgi:hypothetical protein
MILGLRGPLNAPLVAASITQIASPTCPTASHQHTELPNENLLLTIIIIIRPRVSLLLGLPGGHHDVSLVEWCRLYMPLRR